MRDKLVTGFKSYWLLLVIGAAVVGMLFYMSNQRSVLAALTSDVEASQALVDDAKATYASINKDFDTKKHQQQLKERTVSAEKIGKEIIEVDNALTAHYKNNEPYPSDEKERQKMLDELAKVETKHKRLTGLTNPMDTWQLNPAWTLTLESVLVYHDTNSIPVVFNMTTKAGKPAGLVFATYDVESHSLGSITTHYTKDGMDDQFDLGGD